MTYNLHILYEATCLFIKHQGFDSNSTAIQVPTNLSEINSFFCSPINRKGLLFSQCKKGYGIYFLTVGLKWAKCSLSTLIGRILYLVVQFLPVTLLYLLIFVLDSYLPQMLHWAALSCTAISLCRHFILTSTYVMNVIYMDSTPLLQNVFKILLRLYELWNLDFFTHILPNFCVSPSITNT